MNPLVTAFEDWKRTLTTWLRSVCGPLAKLGRTSPTHRDPLPQPKTGCERTFPTPLSG